MKNNPLDFQRATACHVLNAFRNGQRRVLVADEAGTDVLPPSFQELVREVGIGDEGGIQDHLTRPVAAGLRGAKSGGFYTVAVREPLSAPQEAEIRKLADQYINDFYDLL